MELKELNWAENAIAQMHAVDSLDCYEKAWIDFIHYLDRAWNKLEKHLGVSGSSHKSLREVNMLRKNKDELLFYLMQARNTDEHTINQVLSKQTAKLSLSGGPSGAIIHRGRFDGSGSVTNLSCEGTLIIEFHPERLEVVDIINRGVSFTVPKLHQGLDLNTRIPHELGALALSYYRNIAKMKVAP